MTKIDSGQELAGGVNTEDIPGTPIFYPWPIKPPRDGVWTLDLDTDCLVYIMYRGWRVENYRPTFWGERAIACITPEDRRRNTKEQIENLKEYKIRDLEDYFAHSHRN